MSEIFTDEQIKFFRDGDASLTEEEIDEGYFRVFTDEDTMVAPYGTPVESD